MFSDYKVLIIHSNEQLNNQVNKYLTDKGYVCQQVIQYHNLDNLYNNHIYDCIIIENDFPRINISQFLVKTKIKSQPIIIVISDTSSPDYLEALLNAGADDYIIAPDHLNDLDIKIQSIYKHGILRPRRIYRFKDIVFDQSAKTCSCNEQPIYLTKNEFKLLYILISHPYQPFRMSYLFEAIWGSSIYEDGISLPALMNTLIIKLRNVNPNQDYIKRFGKDSYKMAF